MSTFITQQEAKAMAKLSGDVERTMMFGSANDTEVRRILLKNKLWDRMLHLEASGVITEKRYNQLKRLIQSKDMESLYMAQKIIERYDKK